MNIAIAILYTTQTYTIKSITKYSPATYDLCDLKMITSVCLTFLYPQMRMKIRPDSLSYKN